MGFLQWLRKGQPKGVGGALGVFDEIYNPAAQRARAELEHQHERVIPTPSPGDRLLEEGIVVIDAPRSDPEP